jgi:hypothetical protein
MSNCKDYIQLLNEYNIDSCRLGPIIMRGECSSELVLKLINCDNLPTGYCDSIAKSCYVNIDIAEKLVRVSDSTTLMLLFENVNCPKEILALPFIGGIRNYKEVFVDKLQTIVINNPSCPPIYKAMS